MDKETAFHPQAHKAIPKVQTLFESVGTLSSVSAGNAAVGTKEDSAMSRKPDPTTAFSVRKGGRAPTFEKPNSQVVPSNQTATNSLVCWNCRAKGHLAKDCRSPKTIYCYRCGAPGKRSYECGCKKVVDRNF